jgi:hypothetical protein
VYSQLNFSWQWVFRIYVEFKFKSIWNHDWKFCQLSNLFHSSAGRAAERKVPLYVCLLFHANERNPTTSSANFTIIVPWYWKLNAAVILLEKSRLRLCWNEHNNLAISFCIFFSHVTSVFIALFQFLAKRNLLFRKKELDISKKIFQIQDTRCCVDLFQCFLSATIWLLIRPCLNDLILIGQLWDLWSN